MNKKPSAEGRICTHSSIDLLMVVCDGGREEGEGLEIHRKNMVAVHFTTIPCEPNTANRHIESYIF